MASIYKKKDRSCFVISWTDHDGKRRTRSSGSPNRRTAETIASKIEATEALRRSGVVDSLAESFAVEGRRPLAEHIRDYLAHCEHIGIACMHIAEKRRHLARVVDTPGIGSLADLTPDRLEHCLRTMRDQELSARTVNFCRQVAVALTGWLVKTGKLEVNRLKVVSRLDESRDRRRVRRALTSDELASLFDVAEPRGRLCWYASAYFAGLRRGDLQRLVWSDVDFNAGTITVSEGKARRVDTIPMHPALAAILKTRHDQLLAIPAAKVFPTTVTDRTRRGDFQRAGIDLVDDQGRVADLHSLRTTLGTNLARAGVAPQVAQRILRHASFTTTEKHYVTLSLVDSAGAIASLPSAWHPPAVVSTGTNGAAAKTAAFENKSQGIGTMLSCDTEQGQGSAGSSQLLTEKGLSEKSNALQTPNIDAPGRTRTSNLQIRSLPLYPVSGYATTTYSSPNSGGSKNGTTCAHPEALEPDLARVVASWQTLPAAIRTAILAIVAAQAK